MHLEKFHLYSLLFWFCYCLCYKFIRRMKILTTTSRNLEFALSQELSNHNQLNLTVCDFEGNNFSDPKSSILFLSSESGSTFPETYLPVLTTQLLFTFCELVTQYIQTT